ncbi:MAG: hypothetical protein HZA11_09300 [Nitrospirae bacterium]|nr:hypothetical protein [Nitrospirota bacterium]
MYKISGNGVKRISDGTIIMDETGNKDWQEYQVWLAAGNAPDPEFTIDELRGSRITETKRVAALKIDIVLPDWQVRRHHDQCELGVATTLTAADYTARQQACQEIRDASNTIEAEVQASSDPNSIDVVNHTAWPV